MTFRPLPSVYKVKLFFKQAQLHSAIEKKKKKLESQRRACKPPKTLLQLGHVERMDESIIIKNGSTESDYRIFFLGLLLKPK